MIMLDIRDVTKKFGSLVAVSDVSMQVAAGGTSRHHRPQRRRQDHVLQHDLRVLRAHCGRDSVRR